MTLNHALDFTALERNAHELQINGLAHRPRGHWCHSTLPASQLQWGDAWQQSDWELHETGSRLRLLQEHTAATYTPVSVTLGDDLDVLLHRVLLGHSLHAVPCVPLGARLHLHGPWLSALDISNGGLCQIESTMRNCTSNEISVKTVNGASCEASMHRVTPA